MRTETQGKCERCRVRFVWIGRPRLRDALCPRCGVGLARTSRALKWRAVRETPHERVEEQAS